MMRLRDIREDEDLTQKEMADILKTTQANYSRWENGSEMIPLKKLTTFCNFFDVSMDYAVGITRNNSYNNSHSINSKVVGSRLRKFRKQEHITQTVLANFLNTSQSTISAYESGETIILTVFAIEICREYNISLDWLCGRTDEIKIYVVSKN